MTILTLLQVVLFLALMLHTVHLLPAFGTYLRAAESAFQAGYRGAMLTIRLARNILGLLLVTASAAPSPDVHALVPRGIALLLVLAVVNVVLPHFQDRVCVERARF